MCRDHITRAGERDCRDNLGQQAAATCHAVAGEGWHDDVFEEVAKANMLALLALKLSGACATLLLRASCATISLLPCSGVQMFGKDSTVCKREPFSPTLTPTPTAQVSPRSSYVLPESAIKPDIQTAPLKEGRGLFIQPSFVRRYGMDSFVDVCAAPGVLAGMCLGCASNPLVRLFRGLCSSCFTSCGNSGVVVQLPGQVVCKS
jgi:hypothetical protein